MNKRQVRTSGWISDDNDTDTDDFGSQKNIINVPKKKEKRKIRNSRRESSEEKTRPKTTNHPGYLSTQGKKSELIDFDTSTSVDQRRQMFKKTRNVKSADFDDDSINNIPEALDVVVDIHPVPDSKESNRNTFIEILTEKGNESSNDKIFSQRVYEEKNDTETAGKKIFHKNNSIEESFDLIEEIQSSSAKEEDSNKIVPQPTSRVRKQWASVESSGNEFEETRKAPRKRWSKDTSVIRLPEPRRSDQLIKSNRRRSGVDNPAFDSSREDFLRIEKDHRGQSTKIEMKSMSENSVETTPPMIGTPSHTDSSSSKSRNGTHSDKSTKIETVLTIDQDDRSDEGKRSGDAIVTIEESESSERRIDRPSRRRKSVSGDRVTQRHKSRRRTSAEESNTTQSLEEIADLSDSSNDLLILRKKSKKTRRSSRTLDHTSSHGSLSTNDDVCFPEDSSDIPTSKIRRKSTERRRKSRSRDNLSKEDPRNIESEKSDSRSKTTDDDQRKQKKKKKRKKKELQYVSVTIHKCDTLEIDFITKHPMVKVHIVEIATGNYLRTTDLEDGSKSVLQPIITGKFDFGDNKSITPIWEEELIFEHDFDDILKTGREQVMILFEVVDMLNFADASFNYDRFGNEGCWHKIAWAFLKPVGTNKTFHIEKRIRLQLYKPCRNSKKLQRHKCEVYSWWKLEDRKKYPSSLFVTVAPIAPPKLVPVFYEQLPLNDISDAISDSLKTPARTPDTIVTPIWAGEANQNCKIPNEKFFETNINENGCFFVAFSNNGRFLACANSDEYNYPIVVYEVETAKIHVHFEGHKTFIYSLDWSNDDRKLLSVSSDQTTLIWDVRSKIVQCIQLLPHPSYVYCGKFKPTNSSIVATGCYDRIARIWIKDKKSKSYELSQELVGHKGYINSMWFQKEGNLLTADSVGVIIIWKVKSNRRMPYKQEWQIMKKIKVKEISGVTINTILLHPDGSRLLVHSRDNGLRTLDLESGAILQKYNAIKNQRIQIKACISPCGNLLFCGDEECVINVWNFETGEHLAYYTLDRSNRTVTCVDYHPHDHLLAFSTFGNPAPVRIYKFDKNSDGSVVNLVYNKKSEFEVQNNEIITNFRNLSLRDKSRSSSRKSALEENFADIQTIHDRSEEARIKLQRLSENENNFKDRGVAKLFNIIERIDRILLNASKSPDDLETGRSLPTEEDEERVTLNASTFYPMRELKKLKHSKQSSASTNGNTSSYVESSGGTSEILEIDEWRKINRNSQRSRSANGTRLEKLNEVDSVKAFSDTAADLRRNCRRKSKIRVSKNVETEKSSYVSTKRMNLANNSDPLSSSDSVGTYVLEKADHEENNDKNKYFKKQIDAHKLQSIKSYSNTSDSKIEKTVFNKISSSDTSVRSNTTFIIENEIPVPKPRKKRSRIKDT